MNKNGLRDVYYFIQGTAVRERNIKSINTFLIKYCKSFDTKSIKKKTDRKIIFNLADPKSVVTNQVAFTLKSFA